MAWRKCGGRERRKRLSVESNQNILEKLDVMPWLVRAVHDVCRQSPLKFVCAPAEVGLNYRAAVPAAAIVL